MDYRSRWQQRRQARAARQRLAIIAALLVVGGLGLVALNARQGREVAYYALPAQGPSWLTPVKGDLLVCHREGRLVRLAADLSGPVRSWARPFTHPAGFTGRVVVKGDLGCIGCADARLRAVDLRTGLQRWETLVGATAAQPAVAAEAVFVGTDNGTLYAVHPEHGSVLWVARLGARVACAPLVTDDSLVVGTIAGMVHCLRRSDGQKLWRVQLDGACYASVRKLGEGYVVGADDGGVYRISARGEMTGRLTMEGLVRAPVGVAGDVAVVGDSEGLVVCFDPRTMTEIWRQRLAGPVPCEPVVVGDQVWCAGGGEVACLDVQTGAVRWRRQSARQTVDLVVSAGRVYWTTADGLVHQAPLPL